MNNKVSIIVTKSVIISIIYYVILLLININHKQLQTINTLIMKTARLAIGFHSLKWTNTKILAKCNLMTAAQTIHYHTLLFLHKINLEHEPEAVINQFVYNKKPKIRYVRAPLSNVYTSK